jgi:hypothetical protein
MSSGLRSQASNEGQGGGQNPLALQADFSQGIAIAVQEQVARAVSDVSTQLSTGLDKRIDQLDQRAEKRDAERRAEAVSAAREAAEEQAKRFTEILASIATQNTGGAQLGVLSSANPVVPLVPPVLGVSSPEPESSVPVVVDLAAQTTAQDALEAAVNALEAAEKQLALVEGRPVRSFGWKKPGGPPPGGPPSGGGPPPGGPPPGAGPPPALPGRRGGGAGSGQIPYQLDPWKRCRSTYEKQLHRLLPPFVIPVRANILAENQIPFYASLPSGAQDELDYLYTAVARLDDVLVDLSSGDAGREVRFEELHERELVSIYDLMAERTYFILDRACARGDTEHIRNEDETNRKYARLKKLRQTAVGASAASRREDKEYEDKVDAAYIQARVKIAAQDRAKSDSAKKDSAKKPQGDRKGGASSG